MNNVTWLLVFALALSLCSSVTPGQRMSSGEGLKVFFCKAPGCVTDVKKVFCNDKSVSIGDPIIKCTGPPPLNSVCQYDGRAFVSTDTSDSCDFEGDSYIETTKCTDQTSACASISVTTPSPVNTVNMQKEQKRQDRHHLVTGIVLVLAVLVVVVLVVVYFCQRKGQDHPPASVKSGTRQSASLNKELSNFLKKSTDPQQLKGSRETTPDSVNRVRQALSADLPHHHQSTYQSTPPICKRT
ncbi:uncharacterized protein LOC113138560 [Mastacembelus armatus]|uniref:uncharacterized protein LOC113138560 n=1 Tax=Mastacembelus armatus TaxID=205130 RepID=UPI000E461B99|nr:uncharacterized protein LOC113138560 [Mastacembelus armatus]